LELWDAIAGVLDKMPPVPELRRRQAASPSDDESVGLFESAPEAKDQYSLTEVRFVP